MKFVRAVIKNSDMQWEEELAIGDNEKPIEGVNRIIKNFNLWLREGESPRSLVSILNDNVEISFKVGQEKIMNIVNKEILNANGHRGIQSREGEIRKLNRLARGKITRNRFLLLMKEFSYSPIRDIIDNIKKDEYQ